MSEFTLYQEERHWWSFNDHRAVMDTMRQLQPKRVLEFGPGSSTLALIEGGAARVDTCEDNPDWAQVYEERLQGKFPDVVRLHRFTMTDPLSIPAIDGQVYDLALIDGPLGTDSRQAVVRYCLDRCAVVLVPTEDGNPAFRPFLVALAAERGWDIAIRETGPLSGGFALLTPRADAPEEPEATDPAPPADEPAEPPPSVDPATISTPEAGVPPLATRRRRGRRWKGQA